MHTQRVNYVPIDFIKAQIIGMKPEDFSENPLLGNPKSIFKGDLLITTIYQYRNIKIKIFENKKRIEFSGSLHTFYNNGEHNYNDFGYSQFNEALILLFTCFNIRPVNLYLIQLEWGFNLQPPKKTVYVIDRAIQHNSVNKTVGIDGPEGKYTQFIHSNYRLKIYDKAQQNHLPNELLRIEMKQTNWSKYRKMGIVTLQDFIESDKKPFMDELIKQFSRVVFYDIDHRITEQYCKYQIHTFWDETRRDYSNKSFKYHFDKLERLNETIGFNTKNLLIEQIIQKGNELQL